MIEEPRLLTVSEAAELLRISERVTRRLLAAGEIPGKKFGRQWAIPRKRLLAMAGETAEVAS